MTHDEAVRLTRAYVESVFPKTCSNCGVQFETLADYLRGTRHLGDPVTYDDPYAEDVAEPLGILSFANCRCNTTLAIGSDRMERSLWRSLMRWSADESRRRGIPWGALLAEIRSEVDRQALGDAGPCI